MHGPLYFFLHRLSTLTSCHKLQYAINSPTNITASCSSTLDLIITDNHNTYISGRAATYISDNLPVLMFIKEQVRSNAIAKMRYQLTSQNRVDHLSNRISSVDVGNPVSATG